MNILPKKSWHVRNYDNIIKVKEDEKKAAEEEAERVRRQTLAEQQARTRLLRTRAKMSNKDSGIEDTKEEPTGVFGAGHINLFKVEEQKAKNKEYEMEKKKEQEKAEKAIGLLTYLGQSCLDEKPWYAKGNDPTARKKIAKAIESSSSESKTVALNSSDWVEKDSSRKSYLDPIHTMKHFLKEKKESEKIEEKRRSKKKKRSKFDDGDDYRKRRKTFDHDEDGKPKKKSIKELRRERLEREQKEQSKAEKLFKDEHPSKRRVSERELYYNTQYNPQLMRSRDHGHRA